MKNKEQSRGCGRSRVTECTNCKKELSKNQIYSSQIYCSHACYSVAKVGTKQTAEHSKKISAALTGKPKSKAHIAKVASALTGRKRPEITGDKHPQWKGDKVGIDALHDWVYRHLGAPKKCEHCGNKKKVMHWSNISGKYLRDLSDWQRLCVSCHSKFDRNR